MYSCLVISVVCETKVCTSVEIGSIVLVGTLANKTSVKTVLDHWKFDGSPMTLFG